MEVNLIVITELCSTIFFFLGPAVKIGALEIQLKSVLDFFKKIRGSFPYWENKGE